MLRIVLEDNLTVLRTLGAGSIDLIYIDPPFNTGRSQTRVALRTEQDAAGDRTGFQGRRYRTTVLGATGYGDRFDDYLAFLEPRLTEAHRVLAGTGSLFFHIDYREAHYCKVLLDGIFGRESFINEIVWAYDYGGRPKNRWPAKHDTILWYAKDTAHYTFNLDAVDRIPYMAPALVGAEKAARGQDADGRLVAHHRAHQLGRRRPDMPPRSRSGCWSASSRCTRRPATGCWTSSPAPAPSARPPPATAAPASWWTTTPRRCGSWPGAWPASGLWWKIVVKRARPLLVRCRAGVGVSVEQCNPKRPHLFACVSVSRLPGVPTNKIAHS